MGWIVYHGTSKKSKQSILNARQFDNSSNANKWKNDLGDGIYTFIDRDPFNNAQEAAGVYATRYRDNPVDTLIIELNISNPATQVLDLDDAEVMREFLRCKEMLIRKVANKVKEIQDKNRDKRIVKRGNADGFMIDAYLKTYKSRMNPDLLISKKWENIDPRLNVNSGQIPNCNVVVIKNPSVILKMT